jgi:hypothetical protein
MQGGTAFVIAFLAGAAALWGVAYIMSAMARLQSKGNLKLENAIGLAGKVYLRVPARARKGSAR